MSVEIKPTSERTCTNVPSLVIAIILLVVTVIVVGYCGIVANNREAPDPTDSNSTVIHKVLYDDCLNICGIDNEANYTLSGECGNPNKTQLPKLLLRSETKIEDGKNSTKLHKKCVEKCPKGFNETVDVCYNSKEDFEAWEKENEIDFTQLWIVVKETWYFVIIIAIVAIVFSYVFLVLFRYVAIYVVWIIYGSSIGVLVILGIVSLFAGVIALFVIFAIIALILLGILYYFRKRIEMVAKLFAETSKAMMDVPTITFEPILTIISLIIVFVIFVAFYLVIEMAGDEEPMGQPAHVLNWISYTFITLFIIGCQNFIIGGAISRWYFTHDKTKLGSPVKMSFVHLFKFHLGSVCMGALIVTLVKILQRICDALKKSAQESENALYMIFVACLRYLLELLEELMQYLIRNAYILVAKDGTPFYESGKRAFHLLKDNIRDVIALNSFGDFVLFVCRLLIVLISGFVGYAILSKKEESIGGWIWLPLIIGCILAFLIAHCFVMVFEMTVDTIFLCFCIDCDQNDGVTRPYYMSESLKQIMIELKGQAGGTFMFGPKGDEFNNDGSGIPMLPHQPPNVYPQGGYNDPMNPYPQQPYPQDPNQPYPHGYPQDPNQPYPQMYPQVPNQPYPQGYPQDPNQPYPQGYPQDPSQPYPQGYPQDPNQPYAPPQYPTPNYPEKY